jgi:hypothetical protein
MVTSTDERYRLDEQGTVHELQPYGGWEPIGVAAPGGSGDYRFDPFNPSRLPQEDIIGTTPSELINLVARDLQPGRWCAFRAPSLNGGMYCIKPERHGGAHLPWSSLDPNGPLFDPGKPDYGQVSQG